MSVLWSFGDRELVYMVCRLSYKASFNEIKFQLKHLNQNIISIIKNNRINISKTENKLQTERQ